MGRVGLVLLIVFTLGCYSAGPYFPAPRLEEFVLLKTTESQVLNMLGKPEARHRKVINGKEVVHFQYSHASAAGFGIGIGPIARTAHVWFSEKHLVGYSYNSNWPGHSTDFDEHALPRIVEGKSTRAEVESLLGRPTGLEVYPLIDNDEDILVSYTFVSTRGFMGLCGFVDKRAQFRIGKDGLVKEILVEMHNE